MDIEELVKKHKANYWMYTTPEHALRAALTDMKNQYEKTEYEEGTLGHTLGIPYKSAAACRLERLERIIVNLVYQFDKNNYGIRQIDAPGHSHDVPGIWDDDNGEMSGKPCDFCAAWRQACAVHDSYKAKKKGE